MNRNFVGLAAAVLTGLFVVSTSAAPAAARNGGGGGGNGGGGHSANSGGGGGGRSMSGSGGGGRSFSGGSGRSFSGPHRPVPGLIKPAFEERPSGEDRARILKQFHARAGAERGDIRTICVTGSPHWQTARLPRQPCPLRPGFEAGCRPRTY